LQDSGEFVVRRQPTNVTETGKGRHSDGFTNSRSEPDFVFLFYGKTGWGPAKDINAYYRGVAAAYSELRPGDRAALLRSDSAAQVDVPMTADTGELTKHRSRRPQGYDHLYDAVKAATALFPRPRDPARRRVIVAVTDDIERGSKTGLDPLITDLLEADATLDEVVCVWGEQPSREAGVGGVWGIPRVSRRIGGGQRTGASLRDAVQATGGEAIPGDLIQEKFPELMRRIRMRYLLGFYVEPAARREFHQIEVRLTPEAQKRNPNALIRARRGYYSVPASTGSQPGQTTDFGRAGSQAAGRGPALLNSLRAHEARRVPACFG
jgi:hypothetical protein